MKWIEITVYTTAEGADLVADIFFNEGGSGVMIKDKSDILQMLSSKQNWDYVEDGIAEGYDEEVVAVKGFTLKSCSMKMLKSVQANLTALKLNSEGVINVGTLEIATREIEDSDFNNVWKEHFRPITIGDIIICPKWIKLTEQESAGKNVVLIDPGMAFGTGEHETTRLCITLMQEHSLQGKTVIDIGSGSGILGICALKLGAEKCYMSDFDPMAVKASQQNTKLNGLAARAEITKANLLDGSEIEADLILINIVAEVLIPLADKLAARLKTGGNVILSGIIESRLNAVTNAYGLAGFKVGKQLNMGDWYGLVLKRQ